MTDDPRPTIPMEAAKESPASAPRVLTYAAPNVVRPLSHAEVVAWRVTRRVIVVVVCIGVAIFLWADGWHRLNRLIFGAAVGLVLGLCVPMTKVVPGAARSQVRREIRTMLWLLGLIAGLAALAAAFTGLVMWGPVGRRQ